MATARVPVLVTPKASADEIVGWRRGELLVRVTAPADAGRANAAACRLVAGALGVPKGAVSVERGPASRHKLLAVKGAEPHDIERAFGSPGRDG